MQKLIEFKLLLYNKTLQRILILAIDLNLQLTERLSKKTQLCLTHGKCTACYNAKN